MELFGHDAAKALLRQLSAHTLLFVGPEGVGRRRAASWYAALLNCQAPAAEPCGRCASCQQLAAGVHPDYREIGPAETTAGGKASRRPEIRIGQLVPREGEDEPLSLWLEARPHYRWRIGVIDGAQHLTTSAANAFLKILEEPPSYAKIILIAPSRQALLPTVASRAAVVRFGAVPAASPHPLAPLGRPGDLARQRQYADTFDSLDALLEAFVTALEGSLEAAFSAAEALEKRWLEERTFDVGELLIAKLRKRHPARYAAAYAAIDEFEQALAAYAASSIAAQLLALRLRQALGKEPR